MSALPATQPTVADTYARIRARLIGLKAWAAAESAALLSATRVDHIAEQVIPELRDASLTCPPSSAFPQAWVDALEAYAQAQMPGAIVSWVTAYDATGDTIRAALTAALAVLPVDGDGYVLEKSFAADGLKSVRSLSSSSLAPLRAALDAVAASVS